MSQEPRTLLESDKFQLIATDLILLNFPKMPKDAGYTKTFLEESMKELQQEHVICDHCPHHPKFNSRCGRCHDVRMLNMRFLP